MVSKEKMLITFEQHGIFGSNFEYVCMSSLSYHLTCVIAFCDGRGFAEHQSRQSWSVSEKMVKNTLQLNRSHDVMILSKILCDLDPKVDVKGQCMYFLVNASPFDVAISNFAGA